MKQLKGKKCLVTGAASGIGRATAIAAAAAGATLFLTDINDDALTQVAETIRAQGGEVALVRALDISDVEAVRAFAEAIHTAQGSVDVVMNIAGISIWGRIEDLQHRDWRRAVEVNLMGPIHVLESFVPQMIRAGRGGHIVNVSSAAGLFGLPFHAAYSASKFGLRGISEVLRFDLKRHGIGVSLVCPGAVDTGLVQTLEIRGLAADSSQMARWKSLFQKHAITPEKAAQAILKGIIHNRYMVFTSADIWLGWWSQRLFAPPYEWLMGFLNNRLDAVLRGSAPRER